MGMGWWVRSVWRNLLHKRSVEAGLSAEVRGYVEMLTDEKVAAGVPLAQARREALMEMGGEVQVRQAVRDGRAGSGLETLWQDVRYGWRMLRRSPGFTVVAVISLGLGIGANTAIFTVAKKVLFDMLPVKDPNALRMLTWVSGHEQVVPPVWGDVSSTENGGLSSNAFSYPVLEALRKQSDAFEELIAFKDVSMTATVDGVPELKAAELVSGNAFSALGVEPMLGRVFQAADDAGPGAGPVAVISEGYWTERFGRSAAALGKVISLNGVPVTIVGVSGRVGGRAFSGLQMGNATQIFAPITMQPLLMPRAQNSTSSLLNNPQSWWVQILARMRPDVPEARAQAELDVVLLQAAIATTSTTKNMSSFHLKLEPGGRGLDYLHNAFVKPSYVLMALAGLVLVLACVNLANLLLARAAARQREMSTRLALGAGRARILRQMLTESLLLSGLGGALGLAIGFLARNVIPHMLAGRGDQAGIPVEFDWRVLAFTVGVALATGMLFGVAPAWQAMRADVSTAMKDAGSVTAGRQGVWLGKGLVVVQIALSAILLIGAGLFVRTLVNLGNTPLGFRADHVLLFRLNPPRARYSHTQMVRLYQRLEEKLAAIPGVRSVGMSNIALVGDGNSGATFHVSGRPAEKELARVQTNGVGRDFFETMGISIVRGRSFGQQDTQTSPRVAVVNRTLARQFFPNEDPIGKSFDTDEEDMAGPVQIVGVAADTRHADLRTDTPPTFYVLYEQKLEASRMVVEIRTAAEPGSVMGAARAAVGELDRDLPLIDVRTMQEQVKTTMANERVFAELTSGFGMLALVLASIGIYGIMAYTVARRTSEIGIRMALGAGSARVLGMVLREVSWMAGMGILLGVGMALWLGRLVSSMLYGLRASDPLTLAGIAGLLMLIALLAGFGPARRAARIDPTRALRHE
jgi:predicted permease